tara:strand:- start:104 stop:520 length:417 start_codon:yes stop_codon:yes gene_type:complete
MALTPEKKVKNQVVKLLKSHSIYYFFPATGGYGRSGVPDIVCCVSGQFVGIECKAGANPTTALQTRELEHIALADGLALVVNEDTIDALNSILEILMSLPIVKGAGAFQDLRVITSVSSEDELQQHLLHILPWNSRVH